MVEWREEKGGVRMERYWKPRPDGTYLWGVYVLTPTNGRHPLVMGDDGQPAVTITPEIWLPVFAAPEAEARAKYLELTGA